MGSVTISFDQASIKQASLRLHGIKDGLNKAMVGAINDTGKTQKTAMSKAIRDRVNIKKKDIDKHIEFKHARWKVGVAEATLTLSESERLSLKYFGAKQRGTRKSKKSTRLGGVTYQISKSGGKKFIRSAFIGGKSLGEHVYRRVGKARNPIIKLHGISAWGVYVKSGIDKSFRFETGKVLHRNLDRRVNFLVLKSRGEI